MPTGAALVSVMLRSASIALACAGLATVLLPGAPAADEPAATGVVVRLDPDALVVVPGLATIVQVIARGASPEGNASGTIELAWDAEAASRGWTVTPSRFDYAVGGTGSSRFDATIAVPADAAWDSPARLSVIARRAADGVIAGGIEAGVEWPAVQLSIEPAVLVLSPPLTGSMEVVVRNTRERAVLAHLTVTARSPTDAIAVVTPQHAHEPVPLSPGEERRFPVPVRAERLLAPADHLVVAAFVDGEGFRAVSSAGLAHGGTWTGGPLQPVEAEIVPNEGADWGGASFRVRVRNPNPVAFPVMAAVTLDAFPDDPVGENASRASVGLPGNGVGEAEVEIARSRSPGVHRATLVITLPPFDRVIAIASTTFEAGDDAIGIAIEDGAAFPLGPGDRGAATFRVSNRGDRERAVRVVPSFGGARLAVEADPESFVLGRASSRDVVVRVAPRADGPPDVPSLTVAALDPEGRVLARTVVALVRRSSDAPGTTVSAEAARLALGGAIAAGLTVALLRRREGARYAAVGLLAPLYTRLRRSDVLDHATRDRLLAAVAAEPGLPLAALGRRAGASGTTVAYHLHLLERHGLVASRREGPFRVFYAPEAVRDAPTDVLTSAERRVLDLLARDGPLTQRALAERLDVTKQAVNYHVKRLARRGLLAVEDRGGARVCVRRGDV